MGQLRVRYYQARCQQLRPLSEQFWKFFDYVDSLKYVIQSFSESFSDEIYDVKKKNYQMWKIANIEKHFLLHIHKTAKHSLFLCGLSHIQYIYNREFIHIDE